MTQITAKVIAHSKSSVNGKEIITMELEYPRFIHSEFMTHRMFSRNAASSRAIPVSKMTEQVQESPATPVHWGKNQPGMQAKEELDPQQKNYAIGEWFEAADGAVYSANTLNARGVHKQIVNRVLEPFQMMKTVVTATEWENFYWLRNHEDAQPEIKRLAEVMLEAVSTSTPYVLNKDDWHVPYWYNGIWRQGSKNQDGSDTYLEDALAISVSCCAQVSYRKLDDSLEKARDIYKRLVESEPVHASPLEHQATPMECPHWTPQDVDCDEGFADGVTHMDKELNYWSGNFHSWIQYRQLIPNNVKRG